MGKYDGATITVLNWQKFTTRKDITASSWFRLQNTFLEDPDFYDFTDGELLVIVYIFSQCSKKVRDHFKLIYEHASRIGRRNEADIDSAIDKLLKIPVITVDVTPTERKRHADVPIDRQTDRQRVEQTRERSAEQPDLIPPTGVKKTKAKLPRTKSETDLLWDYYASRLQETRGLKAIWSTEAAGHCKFIRETMGGVEQAKPIIDAYLSRDTQFIRDNAWNLRYARNDLQALIAKANAPKRAEERILS